jgi:hypothetical protein
MLAESLELAEQIRPMLIDVAEKLYTYQDNELICADLRIETASNQPVRRFLPVVAPNSCPFTPKCSPLSKLDRC